MVSRLPLFLNPRFRPAALTDNYSVPDGVDYVRQLAESCAAVGVKLGIYYSVNANAYLNVWNNGVGAGKVTAAQYVPVLAHIP